MSPKNKKAMGGNPWPLLFLIDRLVYVTCKGKAERSRTRVLPLRRSAKRRRSNARLCTIKTLSNEYRQNACRARGKYDCDEPLDSGLLSRYGSLEQLQCHPEAQGRFHEKKDGVYDIFLGRKVLDDLVGVFHNLQSVHRFLPSNQFLDHVRPSEEVQLARKAIKEKTTKIKSK
jgi:hypothetical protein